ncbi:hypothetical protein CB1_106961003 [Camelus ferus]|nr:hypothetical protein CB1_106961003 [Camelus ferus]
MAGSRPGSCLASRSAAAWSGGWHGRVLVSAESARGQLPPCPGEWAPPSSACWLSPCRDGPEHPLRAELRVTAEGRELILDLEKNDVYLYNVNRCLVRLPFPSGRSDKQGL